MAGRNDLARMVAEAEGLSVAQSRRVVNQVFNSIDDIVESGELLQVRGFGTFSKVVRRARKGRNPYTGEEIDLPKRVVTKFKQAG
jgi:DNA-binding protein HU-beta